MSRLVSSQAGKPSSRSWVLILALGFSAALFGCKGEESGGGKGAPGAHGAHQARSAQAVRVWSAESHDVPIVITAVGTLEPDEDVLVSSEVEARVTRIYHDEGDMVSKGEVLALLDEEKFNLQVRKAEADLRKAMADHEFAEKNLQRKQELVKEGVVAQSDFDESLSKRNSAEAYAESMEAALALARDTLERSRVKAPFSSYIAERFASVGSYIKKGEKLFRLIDTDPVKVSAYISERYLNEVRKGQVVSLRVSTRASGSGTDGAETGFRGIVYFVSPSIDESSRSFEVKARIKNPEGRLKPGLFADISIETGVRKGVFLVPESAVIARGEESILFVVTGDIVHERVVTPGERMQGSIILAEGIEVGEAVVLEGAHSLKDGAVVKVVNQP